MKEIAVIVLFVFILPVVITFLAMLPFFWGDVQRYRVRRERRKWDKLYGGKVVPMPQKGRRVGK